MATKFQAFSQIASILCATLLSSTIHAETPMPEISRPIVVELFTSQGCSSCPPAEALLGHIVNRPDVLVLAFHVDYWDYIGWRDRFSLPISKERQDRYVQALKLASGFTPQSVVDGRVSMVGSDRDQLVAAFRQKPTGIAVQLSKENDALSISLPEAPTDAKFDVSVITYQQEASTPVPRGENAGHTLKEYNIVRSFQSLSRWDGHAAKLSASLAKIPEGANRVAVIVQQKNQGPIIGAATLPL